MYTYLPKTDENPHHDQSNIIGFAHHERRDQGADDTAQHAEAKSMLSTTSFCDQATWYLSQHVAPKYRTQNNALRFLVPVEFVVLQPKHYLHCQI